MEQAELDPELTRRIVRQQLVEVTGWTLPVIDALSYLDVIDILNYESERRKALRKAKSHR